MNYKTLKALDNKYIQVKQQLDSINRYLDSTSKSQCWMGQQANLVDHSSWNVSNIHEDVNFGIPRDIAETLLARTKVLLEIELQDLKNRLNITD